MCSGMLKTKVITDILATILSIFFHFRTQDRCIVVVREVAERDVAGREVAGREAGVGHIGAGIILSASYLLGFDLCSVLCLKLKVEVFIVSVHGLEFKRSECMS